MATAISKPRWPDQATPDMAIISLLTRSRNQTAAFGANIDSPNAVETDPYVQASVNEIQSVAYPACMWEYNCYLVWSYLKCEHLVSTVYQ